MGMLDQFLQNNPNFGGGQQQPSYTPQSAQQYPQSSGSFSWQDFVNYQQAIQQANQQLQQPWQSSFAQPQNYYQQNQSADTYDGIIDRGKQFQMGDGTESMYNGQYRDAADWEKGVHTVGNWGRWWNNLPGNLARPEDKEAWTFNPNKFNLSDGLQDEDWTQIRNFGLSLPGMLVGGLFEGVEKGAEALTGVPLQEYRENGNDLEIADYKLDASQRAAAALDAAINIGGTLTGGAGRVVGTGGKILAKGAGKIISEAGEAAAKGSVQSLGKAASKIDQAGKAFAVEEALDNMSKGVVTRSLEGVTGKPLGTAAGIVADIGDEAAEEFIQSYADDVRMKNINETSLDRALTGAAWGAVGGGVMGVAGRGASAIVDHFNKDSSQNVVTEPQTFETQSVGQSSLSKLSNNNAGAGMMNPVAKNMANDLLTQNRIAPASTVVTQTGTDSNLDFDRLTVGANGFKQMFFNNEISRNQMAADFGTPVENLTDIFLNSKDIASDLNDLMSRLNRKTIQITVGRNPDTKNGGYYMDIDHFVNGEAFVTHPLVANIVGSDWDGDKVSLYLNTNRLDADNDEYYGVKFTPRAYVTEMLMDPEGKSNVEWWWAGVTDTSSINKDKLKEVLEDELAPYQGKVNDRSMVDYFVNRISIAYGIKDKKVRDTAISAAYTELLQKVNEFNKNDDALKTTYKRKDDDTVYYAKGRGEELRSGRNVLNSVLQRTLNDPEVQLQRQYETIASQVEETLFDTSGLKPDEVTAYREALKNWDTSFKDWELRGTTGGSEKVFQLTKQLHLLAYLIDPKSKYNPIYRQYGQLRYMTLADPIFNDVVTGLADIYGCESIALNIMRSAFKLADSGTSPLTAIEAICDTLMYAEVRARLGMPGFTIRSQSDYDLFRETYIEVQEKYANLYNKAQKGFTNLGFTEIGRSSYRNAISSLKEESARESAFQRSFQRVFENEYMENIFDPEIVRRLNYSEKTFGNFLEDYAKYSYKGNIDGFLKPIAGTQYASAIGKMLKSAVNHFGSEQSAIAQSFYNRISEIKLHGVIERYDANGGHVDPRDLPALLDLMDMVHELVGAREALNNGFILSDDFVGSQAGRMLLSGDPASMVNVITSMSLYGQFSPFVDVLFGDGYDSKAQSYAKEQLQIMQSISPVHELIVSQLIQNNRKTFDYLTSLDINLATKQSGVSQEVGFKYNVSNYVLNSLQTDVGKFAISSVSAKLVKSDAAINRFKQRAYDSIQAEATTFFEAVDKTPGNKSELQAAVVEWFHDRCRYSTMEYDDSIIAMKILASMTLENADVEKATIPQIMTALYNAGQFGINGKLLSQLNLITSASTGVVDKDDWINNRYHVLSCISDPNYRCWVWDQDLGKRVLMTQDRLLKAVNEQWVPGSRVDYITIKKLITKYPQIGGYICEPTVNIASQNNAIGVQNARALNMKEDFEKYRKPFKEIDPESNRDPMLVAHVDKALRDVRAFIFNNPKAHHIITMMLDDSVLEGHIDPRELTREVSKALDHLSAYLYYRSAKGGINPRYEMPISYIDDQISLRDKIMDDLGEDIWAACAAANDRLFTQFEIESEDILLRSLNERLMKMTIIKDINDKYGFNIAIKSNNPDIAQKIIKDTKESLERTMRVAWFLTTRGANRTKQNLLALREALVDRGEIEDTVREVLKERFPDKTDDEIANDANVIVSDAMRSSSMFDTLNKMDQSWLLNEKDFESAATLRSRLESLLGWNPRYLKPDKKTGKTMIDTSVESAFENGELQEDVRDAQIHDINNILINHELNTISAINGLPINENAVQLAEDAVSNIEDMIREFSAETMKPGSRYSRSYTSDMISIEDELMARGLNYNVPPRLNYMSRAMQANISNQKVADSSAGNPVKVGTNGIMGRKIYPTAHIPKTVEGLDHAFARPVLKADISELDLQLEYKYVNALDNEGKKLVMSSDEFKEYYRSLNDQDEIMILHPDDNPHGLPTYNMESVLFDPRDQYHRLSGILGRIVDYSQEQMVLKTKKLLRIADVIVNEQGLPNASNGTLVANGWYSSVVADNVMKLFSDFRNEYIAKMVTEFDPKTGSMGDLGFGKTQARILVQALTPGVIITTKNDNGDFETFVLDASLMFGPDAKDKTQSFLDSLLVDDSNPDATINRQIISAEVLSITPFELSARIMSKVNEVVDSKGKVSASDAETATLKGLEDWSDYDAVISGDGDTGDVDTLMCSVPPVGYAYSSIIPAKDNPSPTMWLGDAVWGSAFGGVNSSNTTPVEKHIYDPDDPYDPTPMSIGKSLGLQAPDLNGNMKTLPVLKIWSDRTDRISYTEEDQINAEHLQMSEQMLNARAERRGFEDDGSLVANACCICNSLDDINKAISWSRRTNVMLFVPESFSAIMESYGKNSVEKNYTQDIFGTEYIAVNPQKINRFFATREMMPHGSRGARDIRKIFSAAIVDSDFRMLGDAEILAFHHAWKYTTRKQDYKEVPITGNILPQNISRKSFISKAEAQDILDQISEWDSSHDRLVPKEPEAFRDAKFYLDSGYLRNNDKIGKDSYYIRQLIVKYLNDLVSDDSLGSASYQFSNPQRNTVAALIRDSYGNIAPVIYPHDLPVDVHYNACYMDHDNIVFEFDGESPILDEDTSDSRKWMLTGETFKGMLSRANKNHHPKLSNGKLLDFLCSSDTEGSRVGGLDEILTARALYYTMKANDMSLFFVKSENSNGEITYDLRETIKSWPVEYRNMLLNQRSLGRDLFDRVISGELKLGETDEQNKALQMVFKTCRLSNINPLYLFSNYRLVPKTDDDGNFIGYRRQNFVQSFDGDNNHYMEVDWQMALMNVVDDPNLTFALFNAVDQKLCPNGMSDNRDRSEYLISKFGTMLVDFDGNGDFVDIPVRIGFHAPLPVNTQESVPSARASVSQQHTGRRAADIGYTDETIMGALPYNNMTVGKYDMVLNDIRIREKKKMSRDREQLRYEQPSDMAIASMINTATHRELKKLSDIRRKHDLTFKHTREVYNQTSGNILESDDDFANSKLHDRVTAFNMLVDQGKEWNVWMLDDLAKCFEGSSWTGDSSKKSSGTFRISEHDFCNVIDEIINNIKEGKLPVYVKGTDTSNTSRFPMPLLPKEVAQWMWSSFEYLRVNNHNNFNEFFEAMRAEQAKAEQLVSAIPSNKSTKLRKKKAALINMARGLRLEWGDTSTLLPATEDYTFEQLQSDVDTLASTFSSVYDWSNEQKALFKELCDASDEQMKKIRVHLEKQGYDTLTIDRGNGPEVSGYVRIDEAKTLTNILNNAAELSKVMAILNPFVTVGNLTDRMFHQTFARGAINLGRYFRFVPNPYKAEKDHYVDVDIRKEAINDPVSIELYKTLREAEFTSDESLFLQNLIDSGNVDDVIAFAEARKKQAGLWGKVTRWSYSAASGGSLGIKQQMATVIDRFVMFAEAEGQTFWFEPTDIKKENGEPMTFLESVLASENGFAKFMSMCLGAGGNPTPSFNTFNKAMNSAKAGDIAQKNAVGAVLTDVLSRVPLSKFLMTTMVSRFPMYGLNITGRLANYILPISSMNYVFTERLGATEYGKSLNIEGTQIHTSLREAIMVDLIKLGVGGTAIALYGILGGVQPPDDERKWGNVDEWLVFGVRAGESWWLEDLFGMALPLACFWRACDEGKPRFDIITNGIGNVCYANPILRCGDIASWLMNPAESLITDFNQDKLEYKNALGGEPSFAQFLQSNFFSFGINFISQFAVPSIVREWHQAAYSTEKSHKRVFQKSASGRETEKGEYGATEYTTYDDAMKRRLAKRNPLAAYLFFLTSGESYLPQNMPDTVYYDDAQLDSNLNTSVSGLTGADKMAKIAMIIATLQSYESMDELAADGFHLDYETMMAVAQQVWDNYHAVDDMYYSLQESGQLNWYALGNGDKEVGQQIAGEILKTRSEAKQYWYNFYYEKLKNSPIVNPIQTYNRYNTTYATDVNGDVYATGILRSPFNFLPITGAPGTISNPEGTAGYENDFASVSAVTGGPMNQRALIPRDGKNIDMPDFEALAADGNGGSYSKQHIEIYGDTSKTGLTSTTTTQSGYPYGGGYGYRSYGGGGGGGGGRSGGGSSYTPKINAPNVYAPSVNLSMRATSANASANDVFAPSLNASPRISLPTFSSPRMNLPTMNLTGMNLPAINLNLNTVAPNVGLSKPVNSRTMNTANLSKVQGVNLRPGFETKGSRDAYRRGDI